MGTVTVLAEIIAEMKRQQYKWGEQNHPDGTGPKADWMLDDPESGIRLAQVLREETQDAAAEGKLTWLDILLEEIGEAFAENDPGKLRAELIQVAAVATSWIEAIDRRSG